MKKALSIALASFLIITSGVSAFADTQIDQSSAETSGSTSINYDNNSGFYTVTIPASVDLSNTASTASEIKAENVNLLPDWEISVYLSGASNTANGQVFHAKSADQTSTAIYTITDGRDHYAVGDKIASFTGNASMPLVFSQAAGATKAGLHSEVLTFTIQAVDTILQNAFDLSTVPANQEQVTIDRDMTITGTLASNHYIKCTDGVKLTMKNVEIQTASNFEHPAIEFTDYSELLFYGYNVIKGGKNNAAIKADSDIAFTGNGTLDVTGGEKAPGIALYSGFAYFWAGTIIAHGGYESAGIGGGRDFDCDAPIHIGGGDITAVGGEKGAGIGAGGDGHTCASITIAGGNVKAYGGAEAAGIGAVHDRAGSIFIESGDVYAVGGEYGAGIGTGKCGLCDGIYINGGTVTSIGGTLAAGIGTGCPGTVSNEILISASVTSVTATKGEGANASIQANSGHGGGTVTIEDPTRVTQN